MRFAEGGLRDFHPQSEMEQELHTKDAVNEALRPPIVSADGSSTPGYTRQQDHAVGGGIEGQYQTTA